MTLLTKQIAYREIESVYFFKETMFSPFKNILKIAILSGIQH